MHFQWGSHWQPNNVMNKWQTNYFDSELLVMYRRCASQAVVVTWGKVMFVKGKDKTWIK